MKHLFILFSLICVIAIPLQAQQAVDPDSSHPIYTQQKGRNTLSKAQYWGIKYNGYTISELNDLFEDEELLFDVLGQPSLMEEDSFGNISYNFNGLTATYQKEGNPNFIYGFSTTQRSALRVTILGKTIRVGDTFEQLIQHFGEDLKILQSSSVNSTINISFGIENIFYDGLMIHVNPQTLQIIEIAYYVNT